MRLRVTSTALNAGPLAGRCIESVRRQTFQDWTHDFIDAASDDDTVLHAVAAKQTMHPLRCEAEPDPRVHVIPSCLRLSILANLVPLWRSFDDDDVIVWLDGDDELVGRRALSRVHEAHAKGALVTYGQFIWEDGRVGFAAPVGRGPRAEKWMATHLKTFRAGLVKHMRPEELERDYICAGDRAIMLAALELAGPGRSTFIPEVLYLYNSSSGWAAKATPEQKARELEELKWVHDRPRYNPLPSDYLSKKAA